ncbi:MAG: ABC transporter ATP-binding protein [Nitrospiraceae bacterium]|nr:ABC transporter ATP-binding protein [Nitrospiraceae bacterium]
MAQIEVFGVSKVYPISGMEIRAVDNVSMKIEKGEFVSIVGHSGSGKTTLLSMIGGVIRPSSGRIIFEGSDISSFDDNRLSQYRNDKVGFMFQFASLLPILTARENVLLPGLFSAARRHEGAARAAEYLSIVGLGDRTEAYPHELSGGQQRRVAIARALMNNPEVILADEPTGDLDEETEAEIMKLFHRLNKEKDITFVLITHNLQLAQQASRQLRMSQGVMKEL